MRTEILATMRLEGKEVINEHGTYIGTIVGVNGRENTIIVRTMFEKKYALGVSSITNVGENVVVREGR